MLRGFDQTINLILEDSLERVYSSQQGVEQVPLGLYIIRGDNMYKFVQIFVSFQHWYFVSKFVFV